MSSSLGRLMCVYFTGVGKRGRKSKVPAYKYLLASAVYSVFSVLKKTKAKLKEKFCSGLSTYGDRFIFFVFLTLQGSTEDL